MTNINEMLDLDQKPILSERERDYMRALSAELLAHNTPADGVVLMVADDFVQVLGLVIAAGIEALE